MEDGYAQPVLRQPGGGVRLPHSGVMQVKPRRTPARLRCGAAGGVGTACRRARTRVQAPGPARTTAAPPGRCQHTRKPGRMGVRVCVRMCERGNAASGNIVQPRSHMRGRICHKPGKTADGEQRGAYKSTDPHPSSRSARASSCLHPRACLAVPTCLADPLDTATSDSRSAEPSTSAACVRPTPRGSA